MPTGNKPYDYITPDQFTNRHVTITGKIFDESKEERFALRMEGRGEKGNSITITRGKIEGWQGCHHHVFSQELYVVQVGKIFVAHFDKVNQRCSHTPLFTGEFVVLNPGIIHDVYVFPGALFTVVKTKIIEGVGEDRIPDIFHDEIVAEILPL